jgi:hypothetical protein
MSPGIKVILAILLGLAASALARFSNGPSPVETYTSGFIYWLNHYSGFYFGIPIAGVVWLVTANSPNRDRAAANCLLLITGIAAALTIFGAIGK